MASPERYLLKGPMPPLKKQTKEELRLECEMWRHIWSWVPHEVRYYVARTGQKIGLTQRNYKRYYGTLMDTHWNLEEIEVGVLDKVYDTLTGDYFLERKIVKMKVGGIIDIQWIKEREKEADVLAEGETTKQDSGYKEEEEERKEEEEEEEEENKDFS